MHTSSSQLVLKFTSKTPEGNDTVDINTLFKEGSERSVKPSRLTTGDYGVRSFWFYKKNLTSMRRGVSEPQDISFFV